MLLSKGGWTWDTMPKRTKASIHYPVVTTEKSHLNQDPTLCLNLEPCAKGSSNTSTNIRKAVFTSKVCYGSGQELNV